MNAAPGKTTERISSEKSFSETIQVTREQTPEQIAEMVEEKLGGKPNITIECTGAESCIQVLKEEGWFFLRFH